MLRKRFGISTITSQHNRQLRLRDMPFSRRTHTLNSRSEHDTNHMTRAHAAHADGCDTGCAGSQRCRHAASCGDGGRSGCARLTSGGCAAKSLGITRHLPEGRSGGSTQRWRAAGAGLVCGTAAHRREALSARSRESCRCARPTLSQLHLGKQAGTGAQSTFEADGRPPETHLWRPLAWRMSHEEGGRAPRRHTHHIISILRSASPVGLRPLKISVRVLVKVPRRALRACGPPLRVAVINTPV